MADMRQVISNDYVDCGLTALFMTVVVLMLGAGVVAARRAFANPRVTTQEFSHELPLLQS